MSKSIIIYNKADFQLSKASKLLLKFHPNVILIDDYNFYDKERLVRLNQRLREYEDEYKDDIRTLFSIDATHNNLKLLIPRLLEINTRKNFVFFNVQYNQNNLENFKYFNDITKGSTVFGWLFGNKDSDGNQNDDVKLSEMLFSWVLLLDSGALSFQTDKDIFFQQENWRSEENHLFVLKSEIIHNNSFYSVFSSINRFLKSYLKKINENKSTSEHFEFTDVIGDGTAKDSKFKIDYQHYPKYEKIKLFRDETEFEKNLINVLSDFNSDHIQPFINVFGKKNDVELKNVFGKFKEDTLKQFKKNLKTKFLTKDKFNFHLISNYITNTIVNLKEKISNVFLFEENKLLDLIMSAVESDIKSIIKLRREIVFWKSLKNRKRFIVYALISFFVLFLLAIVISFFISNTIGLSLAATILIFSLLISSAFWIWRYMQGLKKLKNQLSFKTRTLNKKIKDVIDKYLSTLPFQIGEFLQKHYQKKLYNYLSIELQVFKNGFSNLEIIYEKLSKDLNSLFRNQKIETEIEDIQERSFELLFSKTIGTYFDDEITNFDSLNKQLTDNLFELLIVLTENEDKMKFTLPKDFDNCPYPIDIQFLTNDNRSITNPDCKSNFIIKPDDYNLNDVNFDIFNIQSNKSILIGSYYSTEIN